MNKALADLIRISRLTGKDPALVQAGGGNTSVKTGDGKSRKGCCAYMYIKASGSALKDMTAKAGWRRLRLDRTLEIIKHGHHLTEPQIAERLKHACDDNVKSGRPPSVETLLHSLLDACVIHVHPIVVCAYVNAKNGQAEIKKLFKNENFPPVWVGYAPPGFILAGKVSRLIKSYRKRYGTTPAVLFLAKHGLFVSAKTTNDALRILRKVINHCKSNLPKAKPSTLSRPAKKDVLSAKIAIGNAIKKITGRRPHVGFFFNKDIASFLSRKDAAALLARGPLGAAELVYANGPPMWIEKSDEKKLTAGLKAILKKGQNLPSAFIVKGLGLFIAIGDKNVSSIADVAIGSLIIRNWASHLGGVLTLTRREQNFIKRCYKSAAPR